ncbi:MAG: CPBP family glutamic-type intramembrane protease [Candidatus Helarchaeales archaeon]
MENKVESATVKQGFLSPPAVRIILALCLVLVPLIIYLILQYTVIQFLRTAFFQYLPFYDDVLFQTSLNIFYEVLAIEMFVVLIVIDRKNTTLKDLGISKPDARKSNSWMVSTFLFGFFAAGGFFFTWMIFLFPLPLVFNLFTIQSLFTFVLFMLVGVSEEFYFRGYIFANASKIYGFHFAPIFTSLLFALVHVPKYVISSIFEILQSPTLSGLINASTTLIQMVIGLHFIFGLGLLLMYYRVNLKVIWASVVAHGFYDFWLSFFVPDQFELLLLAPLQYMLFVFIGMFATILTLFAAWFLSSRYFRVLSFPEASYKVRQDIKKLQKKKKKIALKIKSLEQIMEKTISPSSQAIVGHRILILRTKEEYFNKVLTIAEKTLENMSSDNVEEVYREFLLQKKALKKSLSSKITEIRLKREDFTHLKQDVKLSKKPRCPHCGFELHPEAKFCSHCGKKISSDEK